MFIKRPLPKLYTLEYDKLSVNDYFTFSKEELGLNGLKHILKECKKNKKEVIYIESKGSTEFWCKDTDSTSHEENDIITYVQRYKRVRGSILNKKFDRHLVTGLMNDGLIFAETVPQPSGKRGRPTIYYRINE